MDTLEGTATTWQQLWATRSHRPALEAFTARPRPLGKSRTERAQGLHVTHTINVPSWMIGELGGWQRPIEWVIRQHAVEEAGAVMHPLKQLHDPAKGFDAESLLDARELHEKP